MSVSIVPGAKQAGTSHQKGQAHKVWPLAFKAKQENTQAQLPGQENFDLGQVKIEVWWPSGQLSEISLSSPLSLSASVTLVNDNFQTGTISKLKTARRVTQLVENMNQFKIQVHVKLLAHVTPPITILIKSSSYSVSGTASKY